MTSKPIKNPFPDIQQVQSGPSAVNEITVDVEGTMTNPGVYTLKNGLRIQDALISAGGLSENADRLYVSKDINQALKLTDSMKIYIPTEGEQVAAGSETPLVSVNMASASELDALPGVGPRTAEKIIAGRSYSSLDVLVNKKSVSQTEFSIIKDLIQL